jgi:hypothetical protein
MRKNLVKRLEMKHYGIKASSLLEKIRQDDVRKAKDLEPEFLVNRT